jgi:hypothetical protein
MYFTREGYKHSARKRIEEGVPQEKAIQIKEIQIKQKMRASQGIKDLSNEALLLEKIVKRMNEEHKFNALHSESDKDDQ